VIAVLYAGEPITVQLWSAAVPGPRAAAVAGVVEIAETPAGSLVLRTEGERMLCPADTWGRIAWPTTPANVPATP
jgi:hypothetical protein